MAPPLEFVRARAETPGAENVAHLSNCGAGLMPAPVLAAVKAHLDLEASIGGYEAFETSPDAVNNFYSATARLLNAAPEEIAFVENATRAWDLVFYGFGFGEGDRILTAQAEYASNYIAFIQVARKTGAVVDVVPDDEHGQIDVAALEKMIDDRVKLIAITHVPTGGGLVNPAAAVGKIANAHGIPYLLDACQSVGQMPVDVDAIGCDFLSGTGRKFLRGPRGTGFLYARKAWIDKVEPAFLDMLSATWTGPDSYDVRPDATRFETWERYVAGQIGLGVAMDYANNWGMEAVYARIQALATQLREGLAEIPGVTVTDTGAEKCGIVTWVHEGQAPEDVAATLRAQGINTSTSRASSTLLDFTARGLTIVNRAAVHYYNTENEVDRLLSALSEL